MNIKEKIHASRSYVFMKEKVNILRYPLWWHFVIMAVFVVAAKPLNYIGGFDTSCQLM